MGIKVFVHGLVVRMFENEMCRGRALRIAVGIAVLAVVLLAGGAGAATITVNTRGGADYTKIQVLTIVLPEEIAKKMGNRLFASFDEGQVVISEIKG